MHPAFSELLTFCMKYTSILSCLAAREAHCRVHLQLGNNHILQLERPLRVFRADI